MTGITRKEWRALPEKTKEALCDMYMAGRVYRCGRSLLVWDPDQEEFECLVVGDGSTFRGGDDVYIARVVGTIQHIHSDHMYLSYGHPLNEHIMKVPALNYYLLKHATLAEAVAFSRRYHPDEINKERKVGRRFIR